MTRSAFALLFCISLILNFITQISIATAKTGASGLPIPRFVSLRSDKVNLRQGPGKDYVIKWVFKRVGLPIEIIAEYDNWRKVRDSQGAEGWIFHRMVTGRRTALVTPWVKNKSSLSLYTTASDESTIKAKFEPGVLVNIGDCDGKWCSVEISKIDGWIKQNLLWGVYAGEKIK